MFSPLSPEILKWNHKTIPYVAQSIVDDNNPGNLPILADALEEAGCIDDAMLARCRDTTIAHTIFSPVLQHILCPQSKDYVCLDWCRACQLMGISLDSLRISHKDFQKFWGMWPIPWVLGLTCDRIVAGLKESGSKVWTWWDDEGGLDKNTSTHPNSIRPEGAYILTVKATVEADEENANQSQITLLAKGHQGMRLEERLFLELAYFVTTGKHLDNENYTLCTGSLYRGGYVPSVFWSSDSSGVGVCRYGPDNSGNDLRSRSADFLPAKLRASAVELATM